jgi:hypothetical protein
VRNLPYSTTDDELRAHFAAAAGPVADLKVLHDRAGQPLGRALVTFANPIDALKVPLLAPPLLFSSLASLSLSPVLLILPSSSAGVSGAR